MAVVEVREKMTPRGGTIERNWVRLYRRTFFVRTNSTFDAAATVAASLPVGLGDSYVAYDLVGVHEFDTGSFVQRITIECTAEDGLQWDVVVEYGPFDPNQFPQNPLDWPIRITWGKAEFQAVATEDVNGDAILNTAGDYYDPAIEMDAHRPVLRIVRNEATYDPALASQFADTVNADVFYGQDPRTWKCNPITAELEFNRDSGTSDGYYYVVTYEFEFNPDTWTSRVLEQGLRELDASGNKQAITEKGIPVTSPELLDEDGHKLLTGGTPLFTEWDVYPEADFSILNLDPAGAPGQGL